MTDETIGNKYFPYVDPDKNGVIIITPFAILPKVDPTELQFYNISGHFNGKGLHEVTDDRAATFDFQNKAGKALGREELALILDHIEQLYRNDIDSIAFRNLPGMNYNVLAGKDVMNEGAVQWDRADLNRLIAHIRMLYDGELTKQ